MVPVRLVPRALALSVLALAGLAFAPSSPDGTVVVKHNLHPDAFGGLPVPRHIEWTQYDVPGPGFLLVSPDTDAVGNHPVIMLSPGTEVYVPHWVAGETEEQQSCRKRHET